MRCLEWVLIQSAWRAYAGHRDRLTEGERQRGGPVEMDRLTEGVEAGRRPCGDGNQIRASLSQESLRQAGAGELGNRSFCSLWREHSLLHLLCGTLLLFC